MSSGTMPGPSAMEMDERETVLVVIYYADLTGFLRGGNHVRE